MSPEVGRTALAVALFFVFLPALLVLTVPPDSPAFIVSLLSLVVGLAFALVVVVVVRRSSR